MESWLSGIKVFSFDLGYTLFDYIGMTKSSLLAQRNLLIKSLSDAKIQISDENRFWEMYKEVDEEIYHQKLASLQDSKYIYPRLEITLNRLGYPIPKTEELISIIAPMANFKFSHENLLIESRVTELLGFLQEKNFKIILISNFPERVGPGQPHFLEKLLKHHDLYQYFDNVIVSGEYELSKPNPAIFQLALDNLGIQPHEMVHIGDDFHADILGASNLGMYTIWVKHPHHLTASSTDYQPSLTISRIAELHQWLSSQLS